ncbi:MAG: vWA domain-containing protein [Acidimicrobiales bacterium]
MQAEAVGRERRAAQVAVGFAAVLRGLGVEVRLSGVLDYTEALSAVDLARREEVYWAGRATLTHRLEEVTAYDRAFAAFFESARSASRRAEEMPLALPADLVADEDGKDDAPESDESEELDSTRVVRYSSVELLRERAFADYSEADWAEARRLLSQLRLPAPTRLSRRMAATKAGRGEPDMSRTLRRALASDGETFDRAWRAHSLRPRRAVLLVDISGSMEPYARGFLRFAHAAVSARGAGAVEVFVFGTRLTRLTRALSSRDPEVALAAAGEAVADWYGGTRLGEGLKAFNDGWGVRGLARGSIVVILSDGWDRGDPKGLATEMRRLRRVANRLVWVNPLKASAGYSPIVRGMAAALPFVDEFVDGHSLASLESLVQVIAGDPGKR